jgi:hypothetical protein
LSVKLGVPGGFLPLAVLASASGRVAANGKFSIGLDLKVGINSDSNSRDRILSGCDNSF